MRMMMSLETYFARIALRSFVSLAESLKKFVQFAFHLQVHRKEKPQINDHKNQTLDNSFKGAWLVKWRLSVPSVRKGVGSTLLLAATEGLWASLSPVIACMTNVAALRLNLTPVIACCRPFILYL